MNIRKGLSRDRRAMRSAIGAALAMAMLCAAPFAASPAFAATKPPAGPKVTLSKAFQPLLAPLMEATSLFGTTG